MRFKRKPSPVGHATLRRISLVGSKMPRMTVDLLCRCTGHARRKREEGPEQFLRRITHLYCSEKAIETIVSSALILYGL